MMTENIKVSMNLKVREATLTDAQTLFDWRNDEKSRLYSFSQDFITFSDHQSWLKTKLESDACQIYIFENSGESIGTTRVDFQPDGYLTLSWTVAPEHRRRGFGTQIVASTVKLFPQKKFKAFIKPSNTPSLCIAKKLSFNCISTTDDVTEWILKF